MFERFSDHARQVMSFARQEAQRINHEYIGTEHLLLGLLLAETCVAAKVLRALRVDVDKVRTEVEKIIKTGPTTATVAQLPFTPRAKKVLELAMQQADALRSNSIGTEHVLLGLIVENEGLAAQVLINLRIDHENVRKAVLEFLDAAGPRDPEGAREDTAIRSFDRFTNRAKKVISFAREQAQKLNHEYIGTEHILLGLVQEGSGVAANVLKNMNVDLEKIRHEVEKIVKTGPSMVTVGQLPFTPRAKKALELSMEEASQLSHNYIGTEHLLLGLIVENEGIAAQVLMNLGVRLEDVREEVLEFLGASDSQAPDARELAASAKHIESLCKPGLPDPFEEDLEETIDLLKRSHAGDEAALDSLCAMYLPRLRRILRVHGIEFLGLVGTKLVDRVDSLGGLEKILRSTLCELETEFDSHGALLRAIVRSARKRLLRIGEKPTRNMVEDAADEQVVALPRSDREIITMIYYLGYSEEEVARELFCPVESVQPRLHGALVRLATAMVFHTDTAP